MNNLWMVRFTAWVNNLGKSRTGRLRRRGRRRVKTDSRPEGIRKYEWCLPAVHRRISGSLINTKNFQPLIQDLDLDHKLLQVAFFPFVHEGRTLKPFWRIGIVSYTHCAATPSQFQANGLMHILIFHPPVYYWFSGCCTCKLFYQDCTRAPRAMS